MMLLLLVSIALSTTWAQQMPDPDGRLNMYELPIGQGDGHIIQCPNGDLNIFDLGSSSPRAENFWKETEIVDFLGSQAGNVRNIIISHNDFDHYSLLPRVFTTPQSVPNLVNIYISCRGEHLPTTLQTWVDDEIQARDKLRPINGGNACGPNGQTCDGINLCPSNPSVLTKVMAANLGQNCVLGNRNVDSIVLKITYNSFSTLLSGDFEDEDRDTDGVQKQMVDFYGTELQVTVYKLAHHGASFLANKPVWRGALRPKAVTSSGDGDHSYRHPRCLVIDGFMNTLCKPQVGDSSSSEFCSGSINSTPAQRTQADYLCGTSSSEPIIERTGNDFAVYTTVPTSENSSPSINQFSLKTDGSRWEIINSITSRTPSK